MVFQYFVWFSLTFPVCQKFPDFSLTGKCLPIFPGFPVRVGTLFEINLFLFVFKLIAIQFDQSDTSETLGIWKEL